MKVARFYAVIGSALVLLVCMPLATQSQALTAQQPQDGPLIDVQNRSLPEARRMLDSLGFRNVRVAYQWMDDMPPVVLWQFPMPPTQAARGIPTITRVPLDFEWVLIVAQPLPVLPDLRDWRADHALTLLASHGWSGAMAAVADSTRSVVTGQSVEPRPLMPGEAVTLNVAPLVVDSVQIRDTVQIPYYVDVQDAGGVQPWVVALIGAGALALGGLGASTLLRRPRVPRAPEPRTPTEPVRPEETAPAPRKLGVAAFEPMIIDELVWVTHGSARREGGAT